MPSRGHSTRLAAIADAVEYLDASALIKLVAEEPESQALVAFLGPKDQQVSSELALAEGPRAIRRITGEDHVLRRRLLADLDHALSAVALLSVDLRVLRAAGRLESVPLRTLDAIHLATALGLGSRLGTFVSYDRRQLEAARAAGLETASPGLG